MEPVVIKPYEEFSHALRKLQVRQWELSEQMRDSDDTPEAKRYFAADVRAISEAINDLVWWGCKVVGCHGNTLIEDLEIQGFCSDLLGRADEQEIEDAERASSRYYDTETGYY